MPDISFNQILKPKIKLDSYDHWPTNAHNFLLHVEVCYSVYY